MGQLFGRNDHDADAGLAFNLGIFREDAAAAGAHNGFRARCGFNNLKDGLVMAAVFGGGEENRDIGFCGAGFFQRLACRSARRHESGFMFGV